MLEENAESPRLRVALASAPFPSPFGNPVDFSPTNQPSGTVVPFPTMPIGATYIFSGEPDYDYSSSESSEAENLEYKFGALTIDPAQAQSSQQPRPIPSVCSQTDCPIPEPHSEGLYQYEYQPWHFESWVANHFASRSFGSSNPPPHIWESLDRLAKGHGTGEDAVAVDAFQVAHYTKATGY